MCPIRTNPPKGDFLLNHSFGSSPEAGRCTRTGRCICRAEPRSFFPAQVIFSAEPFAAPHSPPHCLTPVLTRARRWPLMVATAGSKGPCSVCNKVWQPGMLGWSGGANGRLPTRYPPLPPHGPPAWSCKAAACQRDGGFAPPLGSADRERDRSDPAEQSAASVNATEYLSRLVSIRGMRCAPAKIYPSRPD